MALQLSPASVEKEAQNWGSSELLVLMVVVANMRMEMVILVNVNMIDTRKHLKILFGSCRISRNWFPSVCLKSLYNFASDLCNY